MHINLPKKDTQTGIQFVQTEKNNLIILGANGSGKTRLGSWVENFSEYTGKTHRISAQKSLVFPKRAEFFPMDHASIAFSLGIDSTKQRTLLDQEHINNPQLFVHNKKSFKWKNNFNSGLVDDFQSLIDYLFSFESQMRTEYFNNSILSVEKVKPPLTLLFRLKKLWEKLLPTKELIIENQSLKTQIKGSSNFYDAQEMSDGERVIFYLIGQCLCVPQKNFIIVDEPELHIHKSLQNRLWKDLELERSDCNFIYLTHNIDFATNHGTDVIWMKSFDGMKWDWELLEDLYELPRDLIYEIVGSRQPILFVEGTKGSFDYQLFRLIFPNYLVKPLGSCSQVIQTVKSIKNIPQLNGLDIFGLIDRDRRPEHEIQALEQNGIFTLKVAEIENMFLIPEILKAVCENQAEEEQSFQSAISLIFDRLKQQLHQQVMEKVHSEIAFKLKTISLPKTDVTSLSQTLQQVPMINVQDEYDQVKKMFEEIIGAKDFHRLIAVYNKKELLKEISRHILKLTDWKKYPKIALKLIAENEELKKCLCNYIPQQLWADNKDYAHPMS